MKYFHITNTTKTYMADKKTLKEIIREVKFKSGLNQKQIAGQIGVQPTYLSAAINGRVPFSDSLKDKIYELYSDYISIELESESSSPESNDQNSYRLVPMYNMDARGGFEDNDQIDVAEYVIDYIPFKDAKQDDICVPIIGNSMAPTYCSGSTVLLHKVEYWQEFLELGQVYMIVLKDGRRLIKELRASQEDKKSKYLCVSHNPTFDPVELPKAMISRVFLVRAVYAKTSM